jgi:ATP-dependent DNA ligase
MLVRTARGKDHRQWLLFKECDDEARPLTDGDILEEQAVSLSTGRDFAEIARGVASRKAVKGKATEGTKAAKRSLKKRSRMPATPEVQLATLSKVAPEGDEWLHEIKFDGYRMLCRIENGKVRFITRNGNDWTHRLKSLAKRVKDWGVGDASLDGEIVAVRPDGGTHFPDLQNAFRDPRPQCGRLAVLRFRSALPSRRGSAALSVDGTQEPFEAVAGVIGDAGGAARFGSFRGGRPRVPRPSLPTRPGGNHLQA